MARAPVKVGKPRKKVERKGEYIVLPAATREKASLLFQKTGLPAVSGYEFLINRGLSSMGDKDIKLLELRKDYMTEPEFQGAFPPKFADYLISSGQIEHEAFDGVKWFLREDAERLQKAYRKVTKVAK